MILAHEKYSGTYRCTIFLPQGVEIHLIFALREVVSKINADFQIFHIWACNWNFHNTHM